MPDRPQPEFAAGLSVLIAEAAHRRLADDESLTGYCTGGIVEAEVDDPVLDTLTGPALVTLIEAEDEDRSGSSNQGELQVLLRHELVEPLAAEGGTSGHRRSRIAGHVKRLFLAPSALDPGGVGVLADPEGNPVTDHLVRFQRIPEPRYISSRQLLVTSIRSLWVVTIDLVTRQTI